MRYEKVPVEIPSALGTPPVKDHFGCPMADCRELSITLLLYCHLLTRSVPQGPSDSATRFADGEQRQSEEDDHHEGLENVVFPTRGSNLDASGASRTPRRLPNGLRENQRCCFSRLARCRQE